MLVQHVRRWAAAVVFLVLFLDVLAHFAGNARADEAVKKINGEDQRQDDGQNDPAQHAPGQPTKMMTDHRFGERAPRAQIQGFEGRVFDFADHHEREKQQQARQQQIATARRKGRCRSSSHIRNKVNEATKPAAAGMGKPRNSLPPPPPGMAARQLKRASRNAPQMR